MIFFLLVMLEAIGVLDWISRLDSFAAFAQISISKLFCILSPSKPVDKQFGKTESSGDLTNSDALVREK